MTLDFDRFVGEGGSLLLQIPSAMVLGDFNVLINPAHREFRKVKIMDVAKFLFDDRIFR